MRWNIDSVLRTAMEIVVLSMVALAPWPFGSVEPVFEFAVYAGIALVLVLWALRILLAQARGEVSRGTGATHASRLGETARPLPRPVLVALAALCLLGLLQLLRLPQPLLATLSPAAADLHAQLLPVQPEITPAGRSAAELGPAGSQLSLYPAATRTESTRYLAVAALFAAVGYNLASVAALRRLCVVALISGALLAGFGLVQFFSAPQHRIYWALHTGGSVFGPFICRNHFAFYLNLCVGLGLGLLLDAATRRRRGTALLHDSRSLWIAAALALMLGSIVFCVSRGGLMALLIASAVCLALRLVIARGFRRWEAVALTVSLALALLVYLKFDLLQSRLATLWQIEHLTQEGRLDVWRDALRLVPQFPLLGTGYGTFGYVEPFHRQAVNNPQLFWDHAHNDYVQVLVEGGLAAFGFALIAIGGGLWAAWRACRYYAEQPAGGLVLGAVLGLTAVGVHSFFDFGLHVPAVALLATISAAHLVALGAATSSAPIATRGGSEDTPTLARSASEGGLTVARRASEGGPTVARRASEGGPTVARRASEGPPTVTRSANEGPPTVARRASEGPPTVARRASEGPPTVTRSASEGSSWMTPAPGLRAALAVLVALVLFSDGWRGDRVRRHVVVAQAERAAGNAEAEVRQLEAAAQLAPLDALLQVALGDACGRAWRSAVDEGQGAAWLDRALQHYVRARNLCPVDAEPQLRLAREAERFARADPQAAYLARAARVRPFDAEIWYAAGLEAWERQDYETAAPLWRSCLAISDQRLGAILDRAGDVYAAAEILDRLLAVRPEVVFAAAQRLPPERADAKRLYFERALMLLGQAPQPLEVDDRRLQARLHEALGQDEQAAEALRGAVAAEPRRTDLRLEYAELLRRQQQLQQARRELLTVLALHPEHAPARKMLEALTRAIAEDKAARGRNGPTE